MSHMRVKTGPLLGLWNVRFRPEQTLSAGQPTVVISFMGRALGGEKVADLTLRRVT
jgi:hypothetical protein